MRSILWKSWERTLLTGGAWQQVNPGDAIDASAHENKAPAGSERYRPGDLRKRALTEPDARVATLTLHPEFSYYVNLSREFRLRAIEAGYATTIAAAKQLVALHAAV